MKGTFADGRTPDDYKSRLASLSVDIANVGQDRATRDAFLGLITRWKSVIEGFDAEDNVVENGDVELQQVLDEGIAFLEFRSNGGKVHLESLTLEKVLDQWGELVGFLNNLGQYILIVNHNNSTVWTKIRNETIAELNVWNKFLSNLPDVRDQYANLSEAISEATKASDRAVAAATEAQRAAGSAGTEALRDSFAKYGEREWAAATTFRRYTVACLLVALVSTAGLAALAVLVPDAGSMDWHNAIYRLAFLTALGGLAAYLARQSSHHRRAAVWAESIEVQLGSFRAFVEPIDVPETRAAMYEAFGRRVLGAPPETSSSKSADSTNPLFGPLLELISKLPSR